MIDHALHVIAVSIGVIGVFVIVFGVLCALIRLVRIEAAALVRPNHQKDRDTLRHHLGFYLLLGLEFLVAADIVETIIAPDLEHLAALGAIVVIRTVISMTLNWELSQQHGAGKIAET